RKDAPYLDIHHLSRHAKRNVRHARSFELRAKAEQASAMEAVCVARRPAADAAEAGRARQALRRLLFGPVVEDENLIEERAGDLDEFLMGRVRQIFIPPRFVTEGHQEAVGKAG